MLESIKKLFVFDGFSPDEIGLIVKNCSPKTYEKDAVVITREEIKKELYIVVSGKIVSALNLPGTIERKHGEYVSGNFFGEMSLFGYKQTFGTFYAAEKSHLLIIPEKKILEIIENNPGTAVKFITRLLGMTIKQLRNSSKFLADVVQWGENASRRVITDELTGLYNRAFLEDALESFFNISKSNNKSLSLLMVDLDNFRKINETFGHETGNDILVELVNLVKNIISRHGIIARYGGDEYSILLPEVNLEKAMMIGEQIRRDVEAYDFTKYLSGKNIPVTISVGISSFPDTATDLISFREKADASLYRAKESGRNKVMFVE